MSGLVAVERRPRPVRDAAQAAAALRPAGALSPAAPLATGAKAELLRGHRASRRGALGSARGWCRSGSHRLIRGIVMFPQLLVKAKPRLPAMATADAQAVDKPAARGRSETGLGSAGLPTACAPPPSGSMTAVDSCTSRGQARRALLEPDGSPACGLAHRLRTCPQRLDGGEICLFPLLPAQRLPRLARRCGDTASIARHPRVKAHPHACSLATSRPAGSRRQQRRPSPPR